MSLKEVTIIITTFRSEDKIGACLDSINSAVKVIIIENSNNFQFKKNIENKYQNVECILSGENLGYGKANNLGLRKVKTKYALVLNPDTILDTDALKNFVNTAKQIKYFSLIGPNQNEQIKKGAKKQNILDVKNIKGFAIFFNMKNFINQNYFDENYFLYFEEIDLCRQIIRKKEKIYINEKIKVYHFGGESVKSFNKLEIEKSRNWHWMWSTFYYHKKNYNFIYSLIIIFPKLISSISKYLFFSIFLDKKKKIIYLYRLKGIINSILNKKSWYRPSLD